MKFRGSMKRLRRALRAVQRPHQRQHRRKKLGEHIVGVLMPTGNGLFAIDVEDDVVRPRAGGHRTHGEEEIARAVAFPDDRANVLVVGPHVGTIAIPLARRCKALRAIEPNPNTFELPSYNIALNHASNVTPLNFAASDRDEGDRIRRQPHP